MSKLPLHLSVKAKNWRMNDSTSSSSDAEFAIVRTKALERDRYTCSGCGFKTPKWQEVHHLNDDHSDNRLSNLTTACTYCHMCQHIGLAGRNEEAVLVWIPELSQAEINHLVRSSQVARRWAETATSTRQVRPDSIRTANSAAEGANALLAALRSRENDAEKKLMTSSLQDLANIMLALEDDIYDRRMDFLRGFKMLPLGKREQDGKNTMQLMVDSWMQPGGPYSNIKPVSWFGMFKSSLNKIT